MIHPLKASFKIEEKLNSLPTAAGIYEFYEESGKIIYIGKAKNLKNRVRTYFQETSKNDYRIRFLVTHIHDLSWTITLSESDALVLEDKLIKIHQPRYNIRLKDNKTYPYIKLTSKELFPRIFFTRRLEKDGSHYYGPYSSALEARMAIQAIRKYFPLRSTPLDLDGTKIYRPCLNYQLKRCLAPCAGKVNAEDYRHLVQRVEKMLQGHYQELLVELEKNMAEKAEKMEYEVAAKIRDQIQAIKTTLQTQKKVQVRTVDADVFWVERQEGFVGVQILFIRHGVILGTDFDFFKKSYDFSDEDLLRSYLSELYLKPQTLYPKLILLPLVTEELQILSSYLKEHKKTKVIIGVPEKPEEKKLLELAKENAKANMLLHFSGESTTQAVLKEVQSYLQLKNFPKKVECFDVSHLSGSNTTASMVTFENNAPKKAEYRQFKVKTVPGIDDYASLHEIITRRAEKAKSGKWPWPDLVMIDGGLGQLHVVMDALKESKTKITFDLISLAKGRSAKKRLLKTQWDYEYVYRSGEEDPLHLEKASPTLHFLQRVRDEAHRFAVRYQRHLARKKNLSSHLDGIANLGEKKKKHLLGYFSSIKNLENATEEEILKVQSITKKDAQNLIQFFHGPQSKTNQGLKES